MTTQAPAAPTQEDKKRNPAAHGSRLKMQGSRELDPSASMEAHVRRAPSSLGAPTANWDNQMWQVAETIEITNWEWPVNEGPETREIHRPQVLARTLYDDEYLAVSFRVQDHYVRAQYTEFQDGVCRDSCCEFFVSPASDSVVRRLPHTPTPTLSACAMLMAPMGSAGRTQPHFSTSKSTPLPVCFYTIAHGSMGTKATSH